MSLNYSSKDEEDLYYNNLNNLHYSVAPTSTWDNPSLLNNSESFYHLDNDNKCPTPYPSYIAFLNDDGYTTGNRGLVDGTSPSSTLSPASPISPGSPHSTPSPDRHSNSNSHSAATPLFCYNVSNPVHHLDILPQLLPIGSMDVVVNNSHNAVPSNYNANPNNVVAPAYNSVNANNNVVLSNDAASQLVVQLPAHGVLAQSRMNVDSMNNTMNNNNNNNNNSQPMIMKTNSPHNNMNNTTNTINDTMSTRSRTMTTRKRRSPNSTLTQDTLSSYNSMSSSMNNVNNNNHNMVSVSSSTSTRSSNRKVERTHSSDDDDEFDDRIRRSSKTSEMIANSYAVKSAVARAAALTPIVMPAGDADDDAELRRQRNKISASQYRKRRKVFVELLEEKVAEMELTIRHQNDFIQQLQQQILQSKNNSVPSSGHTSVPTSPVDHTYDTQQYYTSMHHNPPPVVDEAGSNISRWAVRTAVMFAFFSCLVLMAIPPVYTTDDYIYTDSLVGSMGVPELEIDLSAEFRSMKTWGRRLLSNVNDHYMNYTPSFVGVIGQFDRFGVISTVQTMLHWFSYNIVGVDPTSDSSLLWISAFIFAMCIMTLFSTWTLLVATSKDCSQSKPVSNTPVSNAVTDVGNNNTMDPMNTDTMSTTTTTTTTTTIIVTTPLVLRPAPHHPCILGTPNTPEELIYNDEELENLHSRLLSSSTCSDCTTDEDSVPETLSDIDEILVSPTIPVRVMG